MKRWTVKLRRTQRSTYSVEVDAKSLNAAVMLAIDPMFELHAAADETFEPDDVEVLDVIPMEDE